MRNCVMWAAVAVVTMVVLVLESEGVSIEAYGAVEGKASNEAAWSNARAVMATAKAVNEGVHGSDRVVEVPAGGTFYIFNATMSGLKDVTFVIDGTLVVSNNISAWQDIANKPSTGVLEVTDSTNITFTGAGLIDGQGYDFWWWVIITGKDFRPNLVNIYRTSGVTVTELHVRNSPQYHWNIRYVEDVYIDNINVYVDVEAQKAALAVGGKLLTVHPEHPEWDIPVFPLNTDGIDIAGIRVVIQNSHITNYDDAIAVKPIYTGESPFSSCSQDMYVYNMSVVVGVGMSIGSVPPAVGTNCVRNITFDTQQDQPHSGPPPPRATLTGPANTGCSFFYPIDPVCPTQPRVPITNVVVDSFTADKTLMLPGVILCNATKPCSGLSFSSVAITGDFVVQPDWSCHNADVVQTQTTPAIKCDNSASTHTPNPVLPIPITGDIMADYVAWIRAARLASM
ncbi:uncharacterized protein AMSG_09154 [Thecamonas trahens ATCC 50062]|uniref:Polygalacturonase n=1 Tax=Thecamonas trahens ATCC 50062 TaxID=461836 RepID=A0A0L0DKS8_THETB|nr:hypothetical protein AMSG_09154 [Thecamonas trahens ATCC 50062]KNC52979.1 hypothetical protein AMSG_09154 [Thecamonas trahens ATCC 50062]|eukprot:XP_013754869.1 hypothetical protein AMSG_09154 [Thecamonas trahens ATCC 50062]